MKTVLYKLHTHWKYPAHLSHSAHNSTQQQKVSEKSAHKRSCRWRWIAAWLGAIVNKTPIANCAEMRPVCSWFLTSPFVNCVFSAFSREPSKHHRMLYTFIWTGVKTNKHFVQSEKGECVVPLCPGTMAVPRRQLSVGTHPQKSKATERENPLHWTDGVTATNTMNTFVLHAYIDRFLKLCVCVFCLSAETKRRAHNFNG